MTKLNKTKLIAPCGMNCGICYAYLRDKNKCPGCRFLITEMPISIARCKIRNCDYVKSEEVKFCFKCPDYPCKNLKNLDKRYRTKYNMSEIENLEYIKKNGVRKFVEKEQGKWQCKTCKGVVCVHKGYCLVCSG